MNDRDDLSTADLAAQTSTDTGRDTRDDRAEDRDRDSEGRHAHQDLSRGDGDNDPGADADRVSADSPSRDPLAGSSASAEAQPSPGASASAASSHEAGPLLASQDAEGFRARWTDVQTAFVDSPRESVEQADGLVAEVMQHLAKTFADERSSLERQWDRGDDIATDDLRTAFQRYRSFFERLLST